MCESIERVSDVEEMKDDVFMGYFTVDSDGKKRPVPAPRRLVRTHAANPATAPSEDRGRTIVTVQRNQGEPSVVKTLDPNIAVAHRCEALPPKGDEVERAMEEVARDSRSETSKSGKEVELAEVRGIRISLSTDSQGRGLPLIPPVSDGFSSLDRFSSLNELSTLNEFSTQMVDKVNTLPQQSNIEEAWNQAGPEFPSRENGPEKHAFALTHAYHDKH